MPAAPTGPNELDKRLAQVIATMTPEAYARADAMAGEAVGKALNTNSTHLSPDQVRELFDRVKERVMQLGAWEPHFDNAMQGDVVPYSVTASGENEGQPAFFVNANAFTLEIESVELDANDLGGEGPAVTFTGEEVKQLYLNAVLGRSV